VPARQATRGPLVSIGIGRCARLRHWSQRARRKPPSSDLPHKLLPLRDFPAECCASYGPNHDFLLSGRPTPRTAERTLAARPRSRARSILGWLAFRRGQAP